jgi:hypothetical protein
VRARALPLRGAMSVTPRGRFIPPSWRPAPYQTTGELELWRSSLRALGTELAVISVCSFTCKAVLVALRYSEILDEGSSLYLSLSHAARGGAAHPAHHRFAHAIPWPQHSC